MPPVVLRIRRRRQTFLAVGASAQNWVTAQQTTSQEKRVVAAKRARVRCKRAGQAAVERLRAAQSVFNPLHRAPSRPEMRRFITRGHFSPTGRKLWRSSDGLQQWPRTGQICLRAAVPASRIPASHAQHFSPGVSSCSGGSWSYDPEWSSSAMAESLEQGDSQIDECTECCVVESEGEKMASTSCAGACSKLGEGHTPKRCDGGISTTSSDGIHVGDNANGERSHVVRFAKCSTVLRGESNANVPLLCVERNSGGVVSAGDDVTALTTIVGKEACHGETFKEREEPGEMKTKGPAFDGRHNWESVIATDRSTTDGRVEGTDKPWNGCSGAEDTGTPIPSQHPASSPPAVRCQRYCVTIPWSGDDTGECESVESDRISD